MRTASGLVLLLLPLSSLADVVVTIESVESYVNIRQAPEAGTDIVGRLQKGIPLQHVRSVPGWHEVALDDEGTTGYVSSDWSTVVVDEPEPVAAAAQEPEPVAEVAAEPEPVAAAAEEAEPVAEVAEEAEPVAEVAEAPEPVAEVVERSRHQIAAAVAVEVTEGLYLRAEAGVVVEGAVEVDVDLRVRGRDDREVVALVGREVRPRRAVGVVVELVAVVPAVVARLGVPEDPVPAARLSRHRPQQVRCRRVHHRAGGRGDDLPTGEGAEGIHHAAQADDAVLPRSEPEVHELPRRRHLPGDDQGQGRAVRYVMELVTVPRSGGSALSRPRDPRGAQVPDQHGQQRRRHAELD